MDRETFDRIWDLRSQAAQVAREHEPPAEQDHGGKTPEQRFKALGKFVMDRDEFPRKRQYGGSTFNETVFLEGGVTVHLIAETYELNDDQRVTLNDLVTVKAEWSTGSPDNPLHVDSVSNIRDEGGHVYDSDLRDLALVEESFAAALEGDKYKKQTA
jgi:hypothetical protein